MANLTRFDPFNGLLRLSIPKAEDVKPRQIQIKVPTSEKVATK